MLILSIDSAGAGCGVCVWRDDKVLVATEERMERGQDRRLMPMVMDVMQKTGFDFPALDRIAVTRGPGSFTGLRIGLAAARGIGLAAAKPVIGIDRFAIYRAQIAASEKNLLVVIDSKRAELFCRFYPASGASMEPNMMTPEGIVSFIVTNKNTIVAGDRPIAGVDFYPCVESEVITASALAAKAAPDRPDFLPRPLYIREPDVTFPASLSRAAQ
jgi:tRNA threonylcarbamoyladenosine biosynthesis protein TsaB